MANPITRVAVIMAGGSGERFWPLSRQQRPKQLLRLASADQTLLEESIGRIAPLVGMENVYIATARTLVAPIRLARTGVPDANVIGEPCKRNTAGCLAFAAAQILARLGLDAAERVSMTILTADHRIQPVERFRLAIQAALEAAETFGSLVTIGITPNRPETGYGYIETPEGANSILNHENWPPVLPVADFREKPDHATAEHFLTSGRFYWNSGMFFWRMDRFLVELSHTSPAHAEAVHAMAEALRAGDEARLEKIFSALPDISIDYALMEKARNVTMVQANFHWDDVGSWDALDRAYAHDARGNVTVGDPVLIDTDNCIVFNEPGAQKVAVAVVGVEGLAIVVSEDGVLIVPKDRAQDVKKIVNELKVRKATQL